MWNILFSKIIYSGYRTFLFAFILTHSLKYINSIFLPLDVTSVLMKKACEPISSLKLKCGLEAELHIIFHIYPLWWRITHHSPENILACKSQGSIVSGISGKSLQLGSGWCAGQIIVPVLYFSLYTSLHPLPLLSPWHLTMCWGSHLVWDSSIRVLAVESSDLGFASH